MKPKFIELYTWKDEPISILREDIVSFRPYVNSSNPRGMRSELITSRPSNRTVYVYGEQPIHKTIATTSYILRHTYEELKDIIDG